VYRKGSPVPSPISDDVLSAAQAGDGSAFRIIYAELAPAVQGYLTARGVPDPEAVTSDVFVALLPRLASISNGAAGLRTLTFSIAHARMVDDVRRRARQPELSEYDPAEDPRTAHSAEHHAGEALATARVLTLLRELSEEQREVLILRIVADLSVEQVAAIVGKSSGAVKQLQRRGLLVLRQRLADRDVTL
jgi:RNA polymerase sigma factor (sigma-70 family)